MIAKRTYSKPIAEVYQTNLKPFCQDNIFSDAVFKSKDETGESGTIEVGGDVTNGDGIIPGNTWSGDWDNDEKNVWDSWN